MLFLDEAAEFRTSVLQMLRVPLENHQITLCRAGRTTIYPAKFQLAMSVNSCPCGNYGNKERVCLCSARSIELYWKKFGGPLLDRVDIRFNFNAEYTKEELTDKFSFTLDELRDKIARAQTIQYERQGKLNADLSESEMERFCHLNNDALKDLDAFCDVSGSSTRGRKSLIKVARTLADFDESDTINKEHMSLALALRDNTPIGY
jgi:magnesium chelatase family protein